MDYNNACARLEATGYTRIAEGDWAYVYAAPDESSVVRITPYDPAYLLFVQTCWMFPHKHLPTFHTIINLTGYGYAVVMPRYTPGDISLRSAFLDALQEAMIFGADGNELGSLAYILKRGLAAGKILVPYFGGMDWNLDNILMDGAIPKVIDGFGLEGWTLTDHITNGVPVTLDRTEVDSFLSIPFHRRGQKQYWE